ncbi:Uncharacterized protein PCOAH_00023330 [Plasmodium coatneyi]|uniref:Pv-fam-d protein n=1 Tax=Plasmodium coatneyi TaxID=208452 RepID=A0A1B1DYX9_9APIC|nr:Uncharacterized protein PCOAH_00023330 [Plasmodium coatneyi]ANQ07797.1 Uncharacterized protein PCOAH_00023330 [Plasmodium coatneyi]
MYTSFRFSFTKWFALYLLLWNNYEYANENKFGKTWNNIIRRKNVSDVRGSRLLREKGNTYVDNNSSFSSLEDIMFGISSDEESNVGGTTKILLDKDGFMEELNNIMTDGELKRPISSLTKGGKHKPKSKFLAEGEKYTSTKCNSRSKDNYSDYYNYDGEDKECKNKKYKNRKYGNKKYKNKKYKNKKYEEKEQAYGCKYRDGRKQRHDNGDNRKYRDDRRYPQERDNRKHGHDDRNNRKYGDDRDGQGHKKYRDTYDKYDKYDKYNGEDYRHNHDDSYRKPLNSKRHTFHNKGNKSPSKYPAQDDLFPKPSSDKYGNVNKVGKTHNPMDLLDDAKKLPSTLKNHFDHSKGYGSKSYYGDDDDYGDDYDNDREDESNLMALSSKYPNEHEGSSSGKGIHTTDEIRSYMDEKRQENKIPVSPSAGFCRNTAVCKMFRKSDSKVKLKKSRDMKNKAPDGKMENKPRPFFSKLLYTIRKNKKFLCLALILSIPYPLVLYLLNLFAYGMYIYLTECIEVFFILAVAFQIITGLVFSKAAISIIRPKGKENTCQIKCGNTKLPQKKTTNTEDLRNQ